MPACPGRAPRHAKTGTFGLVRGGDAAGAVLAVRGRVVDRSGYRTNKREGGMHFRRMRRGVILSVVLVAGLAWSPCASADDHIRGVITARGNDGTVTVTT